MRNWLLFIGRLAVGGILIYAGYAKIQMPWLQFAAQIEAYKLSWLSPDAIVFIAKMLPWFEVALGAALILGFGLRWFGALASALLLFFFLILVRSYALGMDIDCGCFGPGDKLTWKSLVRDGAILAVALGVTWGAFLQSRKRRAPSAAPEVASSL
jgi:uncharacterized membrane protein YphA (DoxX/SURF4 family)